MTSELLSGENCRWCGRDLSRSFLGEMPAVEKKESLLFPILCVCGGVTVIGAGSFISRFDEFAKRKRGDDE